MSGVSACGYLTSDFHALTKARCGELYTEPAAGKSTQARSDLANCLRALHAEDTLFVWRLDRPGQSLSELVAIVNVLEGRGIAFESLSERTDTSSAGGKLIFHVRAPMAEFERNVIREWTQAGLAAARTSGHKCRRKAKLKNDQIKQIKALLKDPDIKVADIAKQYGVCRATIFNAVGPVKTERAE